jgi:hypothetical protein
MGDLKLFTYQTDGNFGASLGQPGSQPRTWKVTPALPDFLTFDSTNGQIRWTSPGTHPAVMPPQRYELSVSNAVGSASTTFAVEVQQAPILTPNKAPVEAPVLVKAG